MRSLLLALATSLAVPSGAVAAGPLVAAGDADMAPTAYIDGRLDPRVPGDVDRVFVVDPAGEITDSLPVSNAVTGPAQVIDKSPNGRLAVVVEPSGPAPAGAVRFDQLPPGRQVTLLRLRPGARPVAVDRFDAPRDPTAAEFSPDGRRVLVASRDTRRPLTVLEVRGERFRERQSFGLTAAGGARIERGATHAAWRPDGQQIAVVVGEPRREVLFYTYSARGLRHAGGPVEVEPRPFTGAYSPDGRTYIANSMRIGGSIGIPEPGTPVDPADVAGSLAVIDVRGTPRAVQTVATPIFPEGLAISPDGRRVATVNLQTSALPSAHPFFSLTSTISLWELEGQRLTKLGGDTAFEGILPESIDFDPSGRRLAVATYQRNWAALANEGSIDIWRLDPARTTPTLERRIPAMRGVHSLAWSR